MSNVLAVVLSLVVASVVGGMLAAVVFWQIFTINRRLEITDAEVADIRTRCKELRRRVDACEPSSAPGVV